MRKDGKEVILTNNGVLTDFSSGTPYETEFIRSFYPGEIQGHDGVTAASVHRDPNDPDIIIVMHQFKDMNAAKGFANSEDLKSAMAKGGVSGPPEVWFGEDIEHTPY